MVPSILTQGEIDRARRMVRLAQAYLAGESGPIETARLINELGRFRKPQSADRIFDNNVLLDEVFRIFVAVDSETDSFPIGDVRKLWNPQALAAEDMKIASTEARYREMVADVD